MLTGCVAGGVAGAATPGDAAGGFEPYLTGRFAADTGMLDRAASLMLAAYRRNPGNDFVLNQTFLACLMAGRPEAGDLAARLPGNPLAELLLGNMAAIRGDWTAARVDYSAVKAGGLSEFLVPLLTAWTDAGAHDTDAALALLQPKLTDNLLAPTYALHAALIADLGERVPEAQKYYDLARKDFGGVNLRLAAIVANWEYRAGNKAAATAVVRALAHGTPYLALTEPGLLRTLDRRPVQSATDGLAEAYVSFAADLEADAGGDKRATRNSDKVSEALLRLALTLRPDFSAARLLLAETMPPDESNAAMAVLEGVPSDDPLAPIVQIKLATMESARGNYAAAEARLRQLIAAMPRQAEPWAALGDVQLAAQHTKTAIASYGRAIALAPDDASAWPLYFARANAEQLAGNWQAAETDLKQALALSPDQPSVLNFLGFSWADRDQHLAEARRMLDKAVSLQPDDGAIIDSLGWVELRQGDVADAVRELQKAVTLDPADPEINGHLGDAYWAAGRKLEARYQWQQALALKPDKKAVPRLEAKLQTALRETEAPRP